MMQIFEAQELKDTNVIIELSLKDAKALAKIVQYALDRNPKKILDKRSGAYKLAKLLDQNLPIYY